MITPMLEDAEQALREAQRQLDRATSADDPAVQRDAFKQASLRFASAARTLDWLATPPAEPWGLPLNLPAATVRGLL